MPAPEPAALDEGIPFVEVVRSLTTDEDLTVEVRMKRSNRGVATACGGRRRPRILLGPTVLSQPAAVQRWVAAHEVAHLVCNHSVFRAFAAALGVVVAWAAALFIAIEVLPVSILASPWTDVVLTVSSVGTIVAATAAFVALVRKDERAADVYACSHGFHLPPEAVAWLHEHESRLFRTRVGGVLRTHAKPEDRCSCPDGRPGL